jgi:peptidyl-tRNA hydrolase
LGVITEFERGGGYRAKTKGPVSPVDSSVSDRVGIIKVWNQKGLESGRIGIKKVRITKVWNHKDFESQRFGIGKNQNKKDSVSVIDNAVSELSNVVGTTEPKLGCVNDTAKSKLAVLLTPLS